MTTAAKPMRGRYDMDFGLFNAGRALDAGGRVSGSSRIATASRGRPVAADEAGAGEQPVEIRQAYLRRIEELRGYGVDEGIVINRDSENDFKSFVDSLPTARKASLVLTDSGNLRAVWKDGDGSHLGLHFLGNRLIRYVIFRRRPNASSVSRAAGTDTFQGVKKRIAAGDLRALVYV